MSLTEDSLGGSTPSNGLTRRRLLVGSGQTVAAGFLGVSLLSFLSACGSEGGSDSVTSGSPRKGGSLVGSAGAGLTGFNPILNTTTSDLSETSLMFDGLIAWNGDGKLIPMIAKDLGTISPDGLTYTFKLREGVKWSDGKPLTSKDFLLTFEMMYLPKYEKVTSGYRGQVSAVLESVTAPDAHTIVFKLKRPYSPWLANACFIPALPAHIFEGMSAEEINKAPFNSAPTVTSGVFKFVEWVKQDHLTYERNENYYRQPAYLDKWIGKQLPPGQSSVNSLKTGELDFARLSDANDYLQVKDDPALGSYLIPDKGITNYWYQMDPSKNAAGKIFSDKKVRQALVWGLDREGINKAIYRGLAEVGDSFFASVSWAYNKNLKTKYTFDRAKAESILDEAGWVKNASGIREKDGAPLKFTITTAANATEYVQAAQAMASDWKKIGCDVGVKPVQYAQVLTTAYFDRDFDVIIPGFAFQVDPDLSYTFHSRNISPGGQNAGTFRSDEVDELLDAAVATANQAKRKDMYLQLADLIAEEVPSVPMVRTQGFLVYRKKVVHGLTSESMGTFNAITDRRFMNQTWVSK